MYILNGLKTRTGFRIGMLVVSKQGDSTEMKGTIQEALLLRNVPAGEVI
jgi:hypothetical protein